mgnify:FL=1
MVGLPEFFKQTSDDPYDRHIYRFIDSNNKSIIVESYEQVYEKWFNTPSMFKARIEVLDRPKPKNKKKKTNGGFK